MSHWDLEVSFPKSEEMQLKFIGSWKLQYYLPSSELIREYFPQYPGVTTLNLDTSSLTTWDTGLLNFISSLQVICKEQGVSLNLHGLPAGATRLLNLTQAKPSNLEHELVAKQVSLLEKIGQETLNLTHVINEMLSFVGELVLSFRRFFLGKARFLFSDLVLYMQDTGVYALGIVTLISFLVGLILAYIGAVQLRQFGAQIYVANLVGIGITREMAPIMTAIVIAGRTGAAYAAQLGSMQANEEIDALKTMALLPMDFLVLPRVIALVLMMPLLCLYADLLGIFGGGIIAIFVLKLSYLRYLVQTFSSIGFPDVLVGLVKSAVFGILVAIASCYRGLKCRRSAEAVGQATTAAVVTSLVLIIMADALFAVVLDALNI